MCNTHELWYLKKKIDGLCFGVYQINFLTVPGSGSPIDLEYEDKHVHR